jgi:glycine/serine hydroxymethyltransferase
MKEAEMEKVAELMDQAIVNRNDPAALEKVLAGVRKLTARFPIYQGLM